MKQREKRLAAGNGFYVDDIQLPNMAHCIFVGSPYAHAKIKRIDASQALTVAGVLAVITGKEVVELMDPLPATSNYAAIGWHWRTPKAYPIAADKVRYQGEPVAVVVAEHLYIARDAAELIDIEYEPLPALSDLNEAMQSGSPLVYEEWGDNIQVHLDFNFGDVAAAFKEADRVIPVSWHEGRVSGFPIESRGCIASYDKTTEMLNMWSSTQAPFLGSQYISSALRLPRSKVRIVVADVGGAFGNKLNWWKDTVVGLASIITGRPVKWLETKREFFLTGAHNRDVTWDGEVAVKNDGTILGIKATFLKDLGVEGTNRGSGAMGMVPACCSIANAYQLKGAKIEAYGVVTNKAPYCAYRGYGKDKGVKFMERIVQALSRELDMAPEQIRLKNFIQPDQFPYKQISGYVYDSGNYPAVLRKALELGEVESWRKKQKEAWKEGKYIGVGMAFSVEPAGVAAPHCIYSGLTQARVSVTSDGVVEVESDQTEIGQGSDITRAKVVANVLGVKLDDIEVKRDTSDMPGSGVYSSRGAIYPTGAMIRAARELRARMIRFAGHFLDEDPAHVDIADSIFHSTRNPDKKMTLKELADSVYFRPGPRGLPHDMQAKHEVLLDVSASWFSPNTTQNPTSTYTTYCSGADIAVVEVDVETGAVSILKYAHVHDAGTLLDKDVVEGQIFGGIVQGIGEALSEELVYTRSGELLSNSYTDYVMPTAVDSPDIVIGHVETLSPFTELGQKGMGEAPIIASKAAVINAIEDALSPFKIRIPESPATKERVRKWILESQGG
jgi:carbon-monoxide dehydrogenase large subunit